MICFSSFVVLIIEMELETFKITVLPLRQKMLNFSRRLVEDAADAEDVVQDVFEKLLHYNGIFESEEHLKAWLLRVAINRCPDLTRAAHQKDTELDENCPHRNRWRTAVCWMQ